MAIGTGNWVAVPLHVCAITYVLLFFYYFIGYICTFSLNHTFVSGWRYIFLASRLPTSTYVT